MRKSGYILFIAGLSSILVLAISWQRGQSQINPERAFDNGWVLRGSFLDFYNSFEQAETLIGLPITNEHINDQGIKQQFFDYAVLEERENGKVDRVPIGNYIALAGENLNLDLDPSTCELVDRYPVCEPFLSFYKANGGIDVIGPPREKMMLDGDRRVQYFEFARFEWAPDNPQYNGYVRLTELGRLYFYHQANNPALLIPNVERFGPDAVQQSGPIQVYAFMERAVVKNKPGATVKMFVIVQRENRLPVIGAESSITVSYGDTKLPGNFQSLTSEAGYAVFEIDANYASFFSGLVEIDVEAKSSIYSAHTSTAFRLAP